MDYGLTQESQFLLHEKVGPHLSSIVSFEEVYKSLILGDGRQLLLPDAKYQVEYRNGIRADEAYAPDFEVDRRFICFGEDQKFEAAERKGVRNGRQYLANFFGPKDDSGEPIPLIFAIQVPEF